MEKNGRNRGDPWSLRQTGVYQQAKLEHRHSAWIFLQLSSSTRQGLEKALGKQSGSQDEGDSPMAHHALLLLATVDNWGEYIRSLDRELRDIVSVSYPPLVRDTQTLTMLGRKGMLLQDRS